MREGTVKFCFILLFWNFALTDMTERMLVAASAVCSAKII